RQWLNGQFLDSLGQPLASQVLRTKVVNKPNPVWRTPGGNDTDDQVFLLSMEEAAHWLTEKRPRWMRYSDRRFRSDKLIAKTEEDVRAWWWLRSPGYDPDSVADVDYGGNLDDFGYGTSASSGGVRPAFWLNLES
ncbi:MAG: DUF6273 domain-containing protein, partial [Cellulomonas sp.]|nr:DUF6273 domain-containing protein [Cellulomonas sp.]